MFDFDQINHYLEMINILNKKTNDVINNYKWYRFMNINILFELVKLIACISISICINIPILAIFITDFNIIKISTIIICSIVASVISFLIYIFTNSSNISDIDRLNNLKLKYEEIKCLVNKVEDEYQESKNICNNIIAEQIHKIDMKITILKVANV